LGAPGQGTAGAGDERTRMHCGCRAYSYDATPAARL
jgi:hypothetical protein